MAEKKFFSISEVAELTDTDEKTIRLYLEEELISSVLEDGEFIFPAEDIDRLSMIRRLVEDLGVNLAGVEVILNMREQMLHMQSDFERIIDDMKIGILKGLSDYESRIKRPMIESRGGKKIKVNIED